MERVPPSPRAQPASWWWGRVLAGALIALSLHHLYRAVAARAIDDPDTPWHVLTGRIVAETGEVPRSDTICFTTDGLDLVTVDWLHDLSAWRLYQALGWSGPAALATLAAALMTLALCWQLRRRGSAPVVALAALALGVFALEVGFAVRPRVWSYAFLSLCAALLALPDPDLRLGPGRAAALTALLALWGHVHSGFVYGWALLLGDAAGSWLERRREGARPPPRSLWLTGAVLTSLGTFLVHPHGFAVPARILSWSGGSDVFRRTAEMMPLTPSEPLALILLGLAAVGLVAARATRAPFPGLAWREAVPLLPFVLQAALHRRVVVPLLLVAVGPLASLWSRAWSSSAPAARLDPLLRPTWRAAPWALGLASLLWLLVFVPRRGAPGLPGQLSPALDARVLPVEAATFLARTGRVGRVFAPFHLGGLLGWVLYPQRAVFLDGRTGFHGAGSAFADYQRILEGQPGWSEPLLRWGVERVVAPRGSSLLGRLERELGWRLVHQDAAFAVVERPAPVSAPAPAPGVGPGPADRPR